MISRIKISVQCPNRLKVGTYKELYRNEISYDSDTSFDYQKFVDVFTILYPVEGLIINFSLL